jgi:alpha-methylacyl-CoA racemase
MIADCLAGMKVLDLSQWLPGPHATQMLADLGARVLKVEPPAGDPARALGLRGPDGLSLFYRSVNAGKRVLRLDLKQAGDREKLLRLVEKADVLLESYRPGVLARLGLAPETLRALNPRLVHTALSGWGQTGPYALRAGHDINYLAVGGGLLRSGPAERPAFGYPPVADMASALQAVLATLAALLRRAATGQGGFVDVSLMETVLGWQGMTLTQARHGADEPRGGGLLNGGTASYNLYRAADDGWVSLGAVEAKFWENFCRAVARPDWIARQDEALPQSALIAEVAALFATHDRAHWQALLDPVDCCFEALLEPAEIAGHPQVAARGLVLEQGGLVQTLLPALLDGQGPRARAEVSEIGAADALAEWGA